MAERLLGHVAAVTRDGRQDPAIGEVVKAKRDLKPLCGTHGAIDGGLSRGHGDSVSLQYPALPPTEVVDAPVNAMT
jgi:hypothetical protein